SDGGRYRYDPNLEPKITKDGLGLELNTALLDSDKPLEVDAARHVLEFAHEQELPVVLEGVDQSPTTTAPMRETLAEFGLDLAPPDLPAAASLPAAQPP